MSENEGGDELSLAKTEDLGADNLNDNDETWLVDSPEPSNQQPLSSSSDEEEDEEEEEVEDIRKAEDVAERKEHESELDTDGVHIEISVNGYGQIYIPRAPLASFLDEVKLTRRSLPIPINTSNSSGENINSFLSSQNKNLSGGGRCTNSLSVRQVLGLEKGYCYTFKYTGYTLCRGSLDDTSEQKCVYNFQIVENDTDCSSSDEEKNGGNNEETIKEGDLEGLEEAWKQPLVPAQLPAGVPSFWDVKMSVRRYGSQITSHTYRTFMDQIGQRYNQRVEFIVELSGEPYGRFYTSFRGIENSTNGYLRQGGRILDLAEVASGGVLRMHYLGYRVLENGKKVYCLRSEKISSQDAQQPEAEMALKRSMRKRKTNARYEEHEEVSARTENLKIEWPRGMQSLYLRQHVILNLIKNILGLESPINFRLKLRVYKSMGSEEEEEQDVNITNVLARGGGYLTSVNAFRKFCGNPKHGEISEFKYIGCTRADAAKDRVYRFELLDNNNNYGKSAPSAEPAPRQKQGPKVTKTTDQPQSGVGNGKGPSHLPASTLVLPPRVPDWVERGQQVQPLQFNNILQQHQQLAKPPPTSMPPSPFPLPQHQQQPMAPPALPSTIPLINKLEQDAGKLQLFLRSLGGGNGLPLQQRFPGELPPAQPQQALLPQQQQEIFPQKLNPPGDIIMSGKVMPNGLLMNQEPHHHQQQQQQQQDALVAPVSEIQTQPQLSDHLDTTTPSPYSLVPAIGVTSLQQQAEYMKPSLQEATRPELTQPQPQKRKGRPKKPPAEAPIDWISSVASCLSTCTDLDGGLVGRYLLKFVSFSAKDMENYGKIILQLAANSSKTALQTVLEGAVQ